MGARFINKLPQTRAVSVNNVDRLFVFPYAVQLPIQDDRYRMLVSSKGKSVSRS